MTFFTEETLDFWNGLVANNTKAYLDEHRKEYERHLKEPYQELVEALVFGLRGVEPEYEIEPRKATHRINRDIRFSKDKTPYKANLGITIGRSARHDSSYPGYTARVGVDGVAVAGGLYMPEPPLRDAVRRYVGEHSAELRRLTSAREFGATYGELQGEAHKRAPAELKDLAAVEPWVLNKQWVFWAGFEDPSLLLREDLDKFILDRWAIGRPINEFFKQAIRSVS